MLYFYSCEIKYQEERIAKIQGVQEVNKRIETIEEFKQVKDGIKKDIFKDLSTEVQGLTWEKMVISFTAFNPL